LDGIIFLALITDGSKLSPTNKGEMSGDLEIFSFSENMYLKNLRPPTPSPKMKRPV
jgi:hypothetical protein